MLNCINSCTSHQIKPTMGLRKPLIIVVATVIAIVAGFIFLFKGCLSSYDERSAIAPFLYFEDHDQAIVLTIVKFEKATSYSQSGNFVRKTVSTSYYLQSNDVKTGKKKESRKIIHHSDVKNHPVEFLGGTGKTAWAFFGEIMAFDPFTLESITDKEKLEVKNPTWKGKLPEDRRYYKFDRETGNIFITATDGTALLLDTKTMGISITDEEAEESAAAKEEKRLEQLSKENRDMQDSLNQQKNFRPSRRLVAREIDRAEYNRLTAGYYEERTALYKIRDSIEALKSRASKLSRTVDEQVRRARSLHDRRSANFSDIKTNQDTVGGKWYGLYTSVEFEKLYKYYAHQSVYGETAKRKLFITGIGPDRYDDGLIDKEHAASSATTFLDGGFLVNKKDAEVINLQNPNSFIIVHKEKVGYEGAIQLSRVSLDGNIIWTFNPGLKEWADWIVTDKYVIVLGVNNKELSGSYNILYVVNLTDGTTVTHDYFDDK